MDQFGYLPSYMYGKLRQYVQPYIKVSRNIDCVIQNKLYIGDFASACNKEYLTELGITHIVTCIIGISPHFPKDFNYLILEIPDIENTHIIPLFTHSNNFIDNAINSGGKVLIHCMYGISRSSTILIAYLKWKYNISVSKALEWIRSARPIANPNNGFILQLREYNPDIEKYSSKSYKVYNIPNWYTSFVSTDKYVYLDDKDEKELIA